MKSKPEWINALADRMQSAGFGPVSDRDADFILSDLVPLIARDVIDACAAVADGRVGELTPNVWNFVAEAIAIAQLIRIDVPKSLGMEAEK